MESIFEFLGIDQLTEEELHRFIYTLFCLLIASILFYFWAVSKGKKGAKVKNGNGLVYIALAYFFYFLVGFISVFVSGAKIGTETEIETIPQIYPIISGIISFCFLSSLSFFSLSSHPIDRVIENPYWLNAINLLGVFWLILVVVGGADVPSWIITMDNVIYTIAMIIIGFFIVRYLVRRGLKLLGLFGVVFFLIIIFLQIQPPKSMVDGKFVHISTLFLGPALALAVIMLSFTFNWINELSFYELSSIWVGDKDEEEKAPSSDYSQLTFGDNKKSWLEKIAKDDLEKVIDEMIIFKRHKNQSLELILNIASRNTRNNNNRLKEIISYEDYQLSRNKISNSLIEILD